MTSAARVVADRLQYLGDRFREFPFAQLDGTWTDWGLVRSISDATATALEHGDVAAGVAVAVVGRSRPECLAAVFGVLHQRRCAVLLSPVQSDAALAAEVAALRPAAVLATTADWEREGFSAAAGRAGLVGLELQGDSQHPVAVRAGLSRCGAGDHLDYGPDAAITVSTSGTTGPAKRLPVDWPTFVEMGDGGRPRDPTQDVGAVVLSLPLGTLGGVASIARTVFGGRPLAMMERFDVWRWAELIKEHRPRIMGAPPPVVSMILDADIPPEYFAGVSAYVTGSAPVAPEVARRFEERYGIPVLLSYGATEFLASVTGWNTDLYAQFGATKLGSVGRALPGVSLRVVDQVSGTELRPGEIGLLEVDPPRRAGRLPAGWLQTADRARLDEDGFLWIVGRADGVIIRGGFKVDLEEVRVTLLDHPGVADACVVGLPDDRLGTVPGAMVTVTPQGEVTAEELMEWLRKHLPPYAVPTRLDVVAAIPSTPTFKHHLVQVRAILEQ